MLRPLVALSLMGVVTVFGLDGFDQDKQWKETGSIYQFHAKSITGVDVPLDKYKGHVALIVNVASNCGLTDSNYKGLVDLYKKYEAKGLRILAFPSNQFNQEPGTSQEIAEFAKKYGVTFDMFEKIAVNGDEAHPLYKWLKAQEKGAGTFTDSIKWNFSKFIVDKNGKVVDRFAPTTSFEAIESELLKHM